MVVPAYVVRAAREGHSAVVVAYFASGPRDESGEGSSTLLLPPMATLLLVCLSLLMDESRHETRFCPAPAHLERTGLRSVLSGSRTDSAI